jgi:hypothetical protein
MTGACAQAKKHLPGMNKMLTICHSQTKKEKGRVFD